MRGCVPLCGFLAALGLAFSIGCQKDDVPVSDGDNTPPGPCEAQGLSEKSRMPSGDPVGHRDPLGAKAAKQARAGQITDAAWIRQPATARHPVRTGDFVLANDKIAAYIEAPGVSDGYQPFGGEVLALDRVGDDGKPLGRSVYGETLWALGRQVLKAETVTVLADGSDGKAAIVRASGVLADLPFLEFLGDAFGLDLDWPAAVDYILEPGAEHVRMRLHLVNTRDETLPLYHHQLFVFFQSSRYQLFAQGTGYDTPKGEHNWLGFDAQDSTFAIRFLSGAFVPLVSRSGALVGRGSGLEVPACSTFGIDYLDFVVGEPHSDGLVQTVRRVTQETPYRTVSGIAKDTSGTPETGAFVHALRADGSYLSRTLTNDKGEFAIHVPKESVDLVATRYGFAPSAKKTVLQTDTTAALELPTQGLLHVQVFDKERGTSIPARIQVIPVAGAPKFPASHGVQDETNGRSVQEFAVTGNAKIPLPPGSHRVVVSRGYEWELSEQTLVIESGKTREIRVELSHSVQSPQFLSADFHIHSYHSADSSDDAEYKVKGAIADGLEIPVSSEHEYIIDFQPIVKKLGLTAFAFGMPSEEFTTFSWGHFGIVPIFPRPEQANRGAVGWYGKKPPEVFHTIANLPEKPVLIVNHPRSDGMGGYLSAVGFDRETLTGDPTLYSEEYGALEVFNDSDFESNRAKIVKDWFALLNGGKRIWAVGSSDSHHLRNSPVGYPRTLLRIGHDDPSRLTAEAVRDALRAGKATISGGLYLTVQGPDGEGPGDIVRGAARPIPFQVTVQCPSWLSAKTLETIVDGETVSTEPLRETVTPQGRKYETTVTVQGKPGRLNHWVIFHASSEGQDLSPLHPGRRPFAVSNPVFF